MTNQSHAMNTGGYGQPHPHRRGVGPRIDSAKFNVPLDTVKVIWETNDPGPQNADFSRQRFLRSTCSSSMKVDMLIDH